MTRPDPRRPSGLRARKFRHDSAVNEHKIDDPLLSELSTPVEAPDLTRSIMGQLGYMRVSPKVARRHRLMRWGSRAGVALTTMIAIGVGMQFYQNSDEIRRPSGPTISDALLDDLNRQQESIGTMFRTIRQLSPKIEPRSPDSNRPDSNREVETLPSEGQPLEESWIAPVRWV